MAADREYIRLGPGDIAPAQNLDLASIRCPECDYATEIDPPDWPCGHCGQRLGLFVGRVAPAQTQRPQPNNVDDSGKT